MIVSGSGILLLLAVRSLGVLANCGKSDINSVVTEVNKERPPPADMKAEFEDVPRRRTKPSAVTEDNMGDTAPAYVEAKYTKPKPTEYYAEPYVTAQPSYTEKKYMKIPYKYLPPKPTIPYYNQYEPSYYTEQPPPQYGKY